MKTSTIRSMTAVTVRLKRATTPARSSLAPPFPPTPIRTVSATRRPPMATPLICLPGVCTWRLLDMAISTMLKATCSITHCLAVRRARRQSLRLLPLSCKAATSPRTAVTQRLHRSNRFAGHRHIAGQRKWREHRDAARSQGCTGINLQCHATRCPDYHAGKRRLPDADGGEYRLWRSIAERQHQHSLHARWQRTDPRFIYLLPEFGDTLTLIYGATVRAKAFRYYPNTQQFFESDIATAIYQSSTPQVATPEITPDGGSLNQGQQIVISTNTPGATIRYRTDGRAPSFFYPGTEYTGPVTLAPGEYEITARGYKDGYYKSDIAYSDPLVINALQLPSPTVYPNTGNYNGSVTAYLGSTVLGAEIRYTLDGSTPSGSSPLFNDPLVLEEDTTVKARVFLDGYTASEVSEATYTIVAEAAAPSFSPPDGATANDFMECDDFVSHSGGRRFVTPQMVPSRQAIPLCMMAPLRLALGSTRLRRKRF